MAVYAVHAAFGHPGLGPSYSCESALSTSTSSSVCGDDIIVVTPALLAAAVASGRCRHLPPVRMRADGTRYIRRQALRPWLDDDLIDQFLECRSWGADEASSLADTSSASLGAASSSEWTSSVVEKPCGGVRRPGRDHARARFADATAATSTGNATRLARWWVRLSLKLVRRQCPASASPS